jgi:class III poly(R)-hydroxyalkanoic acid synthase PhaE subunit
MVAHQQYTGEFNKLLQTFDAWINFSKASFDYLLVLLDIWVKAFEELMRELVSSQNNDETVENLRQFLQVWSSIFDRVFAQRFHSEDALEIQGKFMNAAITWRLHQQQLMEVFLKMNDLPTRSELDEVYRSLYELRKELKNLKKTLAESLNNEVL